ncbi:MAG: Hsp33 family molecular chaperone HslO [Gammaproteobacteria bacterium]
MTDIRTKFLFEALAVRGELVCLEQAVQGVLDKHDYPAPLQALLGEALAAAVLLAGTLKLNGLLSLQAKGDGAVRLLMAECTHEGDLRAIARWDGEVPDAPLVHLLGDGHLAITIEPAGGQRYQGIVPLDGLSLAECIEHYFAQSEQLATRLWLVTGNGRAAGLLLQELPAAGGVSRDADGWNRLCRLTDTLTAPELLGLPPETLLQRLYHEEDVRVFDADAFRFRCSCSRERMLAALQSLGREELQSILDEQDGALETVCQFCNEKRRYTAAELLGPVAE